MTTGVVEPEAASRTAATRVAWAALGLAAAALTVSVGGWFVRSGTEPVPRPVAPVSMPMLTAMTVDQAEATLAHEGLKLGKVTALPVRAMPRGGIAYQTPTWRSSVAPGTVVDVWVSTGPDTSRNPKCVVLGSQNTCSSSWSG